MKVIFRKFQQNPPEVVAIFPEEITTPDGKVLSYCLQGQHAAASLGLVNSLPRPTKAEEDEMVTHLKSIGYTHLEREP